MPPPAPASTVARISSAIGGAYVFNAVDSRAEDLSTSQGIVGTVGLITIPASAGPGTTGYRFNCSGTLVARDLVLTAGHCAEYAASDLTFWLEFDLEAWNAGLPPGDSFPVQSTWKWYPYGSNDLGLAVLKLAAPVPESLAWHVAPVYLGDVSKLLGQVAVVAGFGYSDTCSSCSFQRSGGFLYSPLALAVTPSQSHPVLEATLDRTTEAVPWPLTDEGGPLFVYDSYSRRYVLVAVAGKGLANMNENPTIHRWIYLGNPGDGIPVHDHAATLRPHLGPDLDGDGIPDVSDNCAPSVCAQHGRPSTECRNPNQMDTNGDLLGNACCFADPRADIRNSNVEAEVALQAFARPDACDPVPLMRTSRRAPPSLGADPKVYYFQAESWVGDGAYQWDFAEKIGFRFCACFDEDGDPLSDSDCAHHCSADNAVEAAEAYTLIDVSWERGLIDYELLPGSGGLPQHFAMLRPGTNRRFEWAWHDHALAGKIASRPIYPGSSERYTRGYLASAVVNNDTFYSDRDASFSGRLRADLQFEHFPRSVDLTEVLEPPFLFNDPCLFSPGCNLSWVFPWELWQEVLLPGLVDAPMLVQIDPGTSAPIATAWWEGAYAVDLGEAVVDVRAWTFPEAASPWPFVAPSEPIAYLQKYGIDERGIRVAPSQVITDRAYVVYTGEAGYHLGETEGFLSAPTQLLALPGESPANSWVQIPTGGQAIFSASRRTLWLIGGEEVDRAARIRRYEPHSGSLTVVPVDPTLAPSAQVLGAAYDYLQDVLYVLDAEAGDARLVAHDLGSGASRLLWSTVHAGHYASVYLGLAEDGQLVLAVTNGGSYTAWSMDVTRGKAVFTGRVDGTGTPVTAPVMGTWSLTMPVLTEAGVRYVVLAADRFEEGEACGSL